MIYLSAYEYVNSTDDLVLQIDRIRNLITLMTQQLLQGITKTNIAEYALDDGQSKIKTVYRSAKDVADGIAGLEKLLSIYEVRYNKQKYGSSVRMVDSKNIPNC